MWFESLRVRAADEPEHSLRVCAADEPECRRAVLVEERGRVAGEVGVETLRPRRLRPDAVAGPRRARHCVGGRRR